MFGGWGVGGRAWLGGGLVWYGGSVEEEVGSYGRHMVNVW